MQRDKPKPKNIFALMICLCVIWSLFLVKILDAQVNQKIDSNINQSKNTPPGSPSWVPPSAQPGKFDWIQLTSGEWLKGDIKVLYNDKLEFDSDKLDLLELDWEDVKQVRGYQLHNALYKFNIVNQESGTYTHHARATLEIELTRRLDLDISLVWDRIEDPKPEDDGRVPDQDDFYFFFGIGFEL
jgi:hypothetical protein